MSEMTQVESYAKEHNLEIVEPKTNELQLDIDSKDFPKIYFSNLKLLKDLMVIKSIRQTESKSGNIHVYIELEDDISKTERIALQACLGSDLKRELLTLFNLRNESNPRPQFFYERKLK
jgi:hypothetical protein